MRPITINDIRSKVSFCGKIIGRKDNLFNKVGDKDHIEKETLDWINMTNKNPLAYLANSPALVIICPDSIEKDIPQKILDSKTILLTDNPNLLFSKIVNTFFVVNQKSAIHKTAIIDTEAVIGKNVSLGANVVIGKAKIGNNVVILPNVWIGDNVEIGNNVLIKTGASIGNPGFGFVRDKDGTLEKFPQVGNLIIEDNVEIGANTCVDKGSLSTTVIGQGTKINNLCHIAHNVITGKNVVVTGQVNISGSTIIENNAWIGPNASLRGHQIIGKNATIGAGAVVTKNVPEGETWVGNPAKKLTK